MPQRRHIAYMRLDTIRRAPRNPKRHDADGIKASVDHFGLAEVPLLDERTGCLVAGHGRIEDLVARIEREEGPPEGVEVDGDGEWLVPVIRGWASRSDADAEAYLVASNHLSAKAGWDHQGLADLMRDLAAADIELATVTGMDADDIEDLIKANETPDLDAFADSLREPAESDGWPTVKLKVPHHLSSAWESHLDTFGGDVPAAFAKLLGLDPTPPAVPDWEPDLQADKEDRVPA